MTLRQKLKTCSSCGKERLLWKSSPPLCRECAQSVAVKNVSQQMRQPIKVKPKPTVNGKPMYVALYMAAFGYGDADFIPSELSGERAVDVHHLICRGAGSSKNLDMIENLMALTRSEHIEYGDKKHYMSFLFRKHFSFLESNGVKFDRTWIMDKIERYSEID
jgi:hypothetical protein